LGTIPSRLRIRSANGWRRVGDNSGLEQAANILKVDEATLARCERGDAQPPRQKAARVEAFLTSDGDNVDTT
jgi:predicted transcriptional regulator